MVRHCYFQIKRALRLGFEATPLDEQIMPGLVVLAPPMHGARFPLVANHDVVIGREGFCNIVLPKRSVSRKHARVFYDAGQFKVEDLNSSLGTFLNGRRVGRPVVLKDGDRINIYDIPIAFVLSDEAPLSETIMVTLGSTDGFSLTPIPPPINTTGSSFGRGRLRDLLALTRHFGSSLVIDELFPRVLDTLFRMFPQAVLGEIQLLDSQGRLSPVAIRHGRNDDSALITHVPVGTDLTKQALQEGQPLVRTGNSQASDSVLESGESSMLCVPIVGPSHAKLGSILLETEDGTRNFTDDDLEMVVAIAVLSGQAIEYAQSHQALLRLDQAQKQLETARQIQMRMLPRKRPNVPGYDFHEYYAAAESVGGDYYFIDSLPDSRVVVGVADACGKALPAALMVSQFATEVRHVIATARTLKMAMAAINRFVFDLDEGFITFCLCLLDVSSHTLTVVNAGHMAPLCRRSKSGLVERLEGKATSFPLGLVGKEQFHPTTFSLKPGDEVLLFTDGITEAMSPDNQLYGSSRLEKIAASPQKDLKSRVDAIMADVVQFRAGRRPSDDTCLVAFARSES